MKKRWLFFIFAISLIISPVHLNVNAHREANVYPRLMQDQKRTADQPEGEGIDPNELAPTLNDWQARSGSDGFTIWHKDINSGCLYSDHNYTLDIPANPGDLSDISYTMTNWDVDYNSTGCSGRPEVDLMYMNGHLLGSLTGANNSWSFNSWPLTQNQMVNGSNQIHIDTDAPGTGCWCVGVGWIEVRAKQGFVVVEHTPQNDDKNRDFHRDKLDLTITFSTAYDPSTLTSNTFKLQYRGPLSSWNSVDGSFTQLTPNKFRFVPNSDLKDGVRYRATLKGGVNGIISSNGSELTSDLIWYFWTVPNLKVSDDFDYGSGSVCPPSAQPCPGLELTIFQVARNMTMVPDKEAMARLYLRWKRHADVYLDDQVKEMIVDALVSDGDDTKKLTRVTVKRPDKYTNSEIENAANTINIYNLPTTKFTYSTEVVPYPQTNYNPVKYTHSLNLSSSNRSPNIEFDYYFLKDGAWAAGVPQTSKNDALALMAKGVAYTSDQFPILNALFNNMGDYSIGYTYTGNDIQDNTCGTSKEVSCPGILGINTTMSERQCVYNKLSSMLGGNKFVAILTPQSLCPNATSFVSNKKVFFHLSGSSANESTIAHEIGHVFGISTANDPTPWHRDNSVGVEGFQIDSKVNRSNTENPSMSISLMHHVWQPTKWMHNEDYSTLLGNVRSMEISEWRTSELYLIVSGSIDIVSSNIDLNPAYLQELPNDPPSATGTCTIELLDENSNVLVSDFTTPGDEVIIESDEEQTSYVQNEDSRESAEPQFLSVSLPWDDTAAKLRISCEGKELLTYVRSVNPPTVDFFGLSEGANLSGSQVITWAGSDLDGSNLAYQLQFSENGGTSWRPLMPLGLETSFSLDTTLLSSGLNQQLRILVTDGFDTSYSTRTINIINPLVVQTILPTIAETDVYVTSPIHLWFVTDVEESSLQSGGFQLLQSGVTPVQGVVSYDSDSKSAVFIPDVPLNFATSYTARLAESVRDVNGNTLGSNYQWSFTTISDSIPPLIIKESPADTELGVPLNALIQAQFDEAINSTTLNSLSFHVEDEYGTPVSGSIVYNTSNRQALFKPSVNLLPGTTYTAIITTDVKDTAGIPLELPYEWHFTTGTETFNGLRIVGNYYDQANDNNNDGLFDNLQITIDVEVLTSGTYNLNARLIDGNGELLEWQTTNSIALAPGIHTLQLVFNGAPIRSNGINGPYILDALHFYNVSNATYFDLWFNAYETYPYDATDFYSLLRLNSLPDQELKINTNLNNAFNLEDYTSHDTLPISNISYSIFVNTDPRVGVSIDENNYIDINPEPDTTAESDVTIKAIDTLGNWVTNTFHISVYESSLISIFFPLVINNYDPSAFTIVPILTSPVDGTTLNTLIPTLTWQVDSSLHPYTYLYYWISSDPSFSTYNSGNAWASNGQVRLNFNLTPGTTYYWYAAYDYINEVTGYWEIGPTTPVRSFRTGSGGTILPAPTLISPSNGSTGINTFPIILDWNPVAGALEYEVQLWFECDPPYWCYYRRFTTDTQLSYPNYYFDSNTYYEWVVIPRNDYAWGNYSDWWSFTTGTVPDSSVDRDQIVIDHLFYIDESGAHIPYSEVKGKGLK